MRDWLARKLVFVSRSTTTPTSRRPRSPASARIPRSPVTFTPMRSASRLAFRSSMRHKAESSEARQIAARSPRPRARLVPIDSGLRTSSQLGGAEIQALTASGAPGLKLLNDCWWDHYAAENGGKDFHCLDQHEVIQRRGIRDNDHSPSTLFSASRSRSRSSTE